MMMPGAGSAFGYIRIHDNATGLTAGVTGRQGMLTLPRHLIPPLMIPRVRVSPIFTVDCTIYLIWTLVLTADFPLFCTHFDFTDFDCTHWFLLWIVPFACCWHTDLATDFLFEIGLTADVTGRQGVLTPPRHQIPPPVCLEVRVSPFIYLTCNSYLCYETITLWYLRDWSLFGVWAILYPQEQSTV
jgi:hypothetical protein